MTVADGGIFTREAYDAIYTEVMKMLTLEGLNLTFRRLLLSSDERGILILEFLWLPVWPCDLFHIGMVMLQSYKALIEG